MAAATGDLLIFSYINGSNVESVLKGQTQAQAAAAIAAAFIAGTVYRIEFYFS